jgi:PKD repeat protein
VAVFLAALTATIRGGAISGTCNISPAQVAGTAWTVTNGSVLCGGTYQVDSLDIPSGVSVYELNGESVVIEASTWIHIAGALNADGAGGVGGSGSNSASGSGGAGGGPGGGPGGPGNTATLGGGGGGGGGGGFGCDGGNCGGAGGIGDGMNTHVDGGVAYDTANSFSLPQYAGSGGGGGGCTNVSGQGGGNGGNGGGAVVLIAPEIHIDATGSVTANGASGSGGNGGGSGGGGSGGDILLEGTQVFSNAGVIAANGAVGANSTNAGLDNGGGGGGGSGGRLKLVTPTSCSISGSLSVTGASGGAGAGSGVVTATAGGSGLNGSSACITASSYTTLSPTTSPSSVAAGTATTISANVTNPYGYDISYQYDCTGTGSSYGALTSASTTTCTWATLGTHTVLVKGSASNSVMLYDGTPPGQDVLFNVPAASVNVSVIDIPMVSITAPSTAPAASSVTSIQGSVSDPAGYVISAWEWSFGDGSTASVSSAATTNIQSHTYTEPGTYTITVTVTDSHGSSGSKSTTIVISDVAPTVSIGTLPSPINAQINATFSAQATSPEPEQAAAGFTFTFTWGDGSANSVVSAAANDDGRVTAQHSYSSPGTFLLTVAAEDNLGTFSTTSEMVTVANPIPSVMLGAMKTTVGTGVPLQTTTEASSTYAPADAAGFTFVYAWGDGQTTTATGFSPQNINHLYESPGNYAVTVTVSDNTGVSGSAALPIIIIESVPTVVIGTPNPSPLAAATATAFPVMTSSLSTIAASTGFTYVFSWGDGTPSTTIPAAPANGSTSSSHTYAEPGSYTLTVNATDTFGGMGGASTTLVVADAPPTAAFGATSYSGTAASPVTFSATASSPVSSVESGTFTYRITWGDGQGATVTGGASISTTHTYDAGGTYTASLFVLDSLSTNSPTVNASVAIANVAPIITEFTHPDGTTGALTSFSVVVNDVSDADTLAGFTIAWSFGDGSPTQTGANLTSTSHQYTAPGTYAVSATATDENGLSATASAMITIRDTPPTVSLGPPRSVARSTPVTLTPSFTPDNLAWTYTYAWTLGNGTSASSPSVTESFASLGSYTVSVVITDPYGASGTGSVTINVVAEATDAGEFDDAGSSAGPDAGLSDAGKTDAGGEDAGDEDAGERPDAAVVTDAGVASAPPCRYTIANDGTPEGTVHDVVTGLTWQQKVLAGTYSWSGAEASCQSLGSDWRLPTLKELASIVDVSAWNPAIDEAAFPGTPGGFFWSSTLLGNDAGTGEVWGISFGDGNVHTAAVGTNSSVRCVH